MNPWFETGGVLLVGIVGVALGRWFSRLQKLYWTVIDDRYVTVGEPLNGRQTLTHAEFARKWRFVGVVLKRHESNERRKAEPERLR